MAFGGSGGPEVEAAHATELNPANTGRLVVDDLASAARALQEIFARPGELTARISGLEWALSGRERSAVLETLVSERVSEEMLAGAIAAERQGWPDGDPRHLLFDTLWRTATDFANLPHHPEAMGSDLFEVAAAEARLFLLLIATLSEYQGATR